MCLNEGQVSSVLDTAQKCVSHPKLLLTQAGKVQAAQSQIKWATPVGLLAAAVAIVHAKDLPPVPKDLRQPYD